jgi:hypothetical protein
MTGRTFSSHDVDVRESGATATLLSAGLIGLAVTLNAPFLSQIGVRLGLGSSVVGPTLAIFWTVFVVVAAVVALESRVATKVSASPHYFVAIESEAADNSAVIAVAELFSAIGLDAQVSAVGLRPSEESLPPSIRIFGSIPRLFMSMRTSKGLPFSATPGERLRSFLTRLDAARRPGSRPGPLQIEDAQLYLRVLLTAPRPIWADEILVRLDLDHLPSDASREFRELRFDRERNSWVLFLSDGLGFEVR